MQKYNTKKAYADLESDRYVFLDRARECSKLTIPFLIPDEGDDKDHRFRTPYQGFGARAVNNLASKLLLALFPTSSPFFRFSADEADTQDAERDEPEIRTQNEAELKKREKVVMHELEATPYRSPFFLALKYLIVSGNALLYLSPDGDIRVFRLDSYVVRRDPSGNVMEIIVKEKLNPLMIDPKVRVAHGIEIKENTKNFKESVVELYTHVMRTDKGWKVHQEINGKVVEGSEGSYTKDANPWLPLRFSRLDGEDYGRGLVEEYFGDFVAIEGFRQNLTDGAAAMSKVLFMVRKNGQTRLKDITESENGDVVYGSGDDVTVLQADKRADFAVIRETNRDIEAELAKAFLLNSSVQRDAERVTATEIRILARELEDTLGGVYTIQSQEFQLPFIKIFTDRLEKAGKLIKVGKGQIKPTIITGLTALGRTDDLDRMLQFMEISQLISQAPPEINKRTALTRAATSLSIDQEGLLVDQAALDQQQQQQQAAELAQGAAPGAIQEVLKGALNGQQG